MICCRVIFCTGGDDLAVANAAAAIVAEMALLVLLLEAVVELELAEAFEGGDFRFLTLELGALFTNDDGETSSNLGRIEVSSKVNWLSSLAAPFSPLLHPLVSLVEPGFVRGGAGE